MDFESNFNDPSTGRAMPNLPGSPTHHGAPNPTATNQPTDPPPSAAPPPVAPPPHHNAALTGQPTTKPPSRSTAGIVFSIIALLAALVIGLFAMLLTWAIFSPVFSGTDVAAGEPIELDAGTYFISSSNSPDVARKVEATDESGQPIFVFDGHVITNGLHIETTTSGLVTFDQDVSITDDPGLGGFGFFVFSIFGLIGWAISIPLAIAGGIGLKKSLRTR